MVTFNEEKQEEQLKELRLAEQEEFARMLSAQQGVPYIDLSMISVNTDALKIIPEDTAREVGIMAFQITGKNVEAAALSPKNEVTVAVIDALKKKGYTINLYIASKHSLERGWKLYKEVSQSVVTEAGVFDISQGNIATYQEKLGTIDDMATALNELTAGKKKIQTSDVLEILIAGSLATKASDIHMEPKDEDVKIRLRLDGVLQDLAGIDHKLYRFILSRIKLLSGLKINVRDEAQDGRFGIKLQDKEIEIRTSIIPGAYGESIVLRILNPDAISVKMEDLGMTPKLLAILDREVSKPNGMILNTGPTGSGKTTTLYAFLKRISTPEIKILTIEDPVEYHLPNITQTQTDNEKGYTFLEGLRAALRQDPDVIMVGEIRDTETAGTAVNAALTGHLVLSTLHTNTAAGAIPRLIDLKINPKIIGSSLNAVIAQRLVRKLCAECKTESALDEKERTIIQNIVDSLPEEEKTAVGTVEKMWKPGACAACNNTGYKGRLGVYEVVLANEEIENVIINNPSEREIRRIARSQGLLEMVQDGVIKILEGKTSLEELQRVLDVEEAF